LTQLRIFCLTKIGAIHNIAKIFKNIQLMLLKMLHNGFKNDEQMFSEGSKKLKKLERFYKKIFDNLD
jgi:hypothetical protein